MGNIDPRSVANPGRSGRQSDDPPTPQESPKVLEIRSRLAESIASLQTLRENLEERGDAIEALQDRIDELKIRLKETGA